MPYCFEQAIYVESLDPAISFDLAKPRIPIGVTSVIRKRIASLDETATTASLHDISAASVKTEKTQTSIRGKEVRREQLTDKR